jgi:hypothetical protein
MDCKMLTMYFFTGTIGVGVPLCIMELTLFFLTLCLVIGLITGGGLMTGGYDCLQNDVQY